MCAAVVPFFFVVKVKGWLGYDDALDTFGVHAVGGTLGALLTGFLATGKVNANIGVAAPANPATTNGMAALIEGHKLWMAQLEAIGVTLALAIVATTVLGLVLKAVLGLRPTEEVEETGLDVSEHGEEGYHTGGEEGFGHAAGFSPGMQAAMAEPS